MYASRRSILLKIHTFSIFFRTFSVIVGGLTLDDDFQRDWNPMAGSFTAYHSAALIAQRPIQKGEELFVHPKYRHNNNNQQQQQQQHQMTSTSQHYDTVQIMVNDLVTIKGITTAQWVDLLHRIQETILDPIVAQLLPKSRHELTRAAKLGVARSQLIDRDFDWVQKDGTCLDGIRQGSSTILQKEEDNDDEWGER